MVAAGRLYRLAGLEKGQAETPLELLSLYLLNGAANGCAVFVCACHPGSICRHTGFSSIALNKAHQFVAMNNKFNANKQLTY
jgi:hypothetical protein